MKLSSYLQSLPTRKAKEDFARRCGTTLPYLRKLAGGHGLPSLSLLHVLRKHAPKLTMEAFIECRNERLKKQR